MTTNDSIYLCAPVNALVEGLFERNVPLAEIKQHGDFDLRTFNDLDGEMVLLDGAVYQIAAAGQVHVIEGEQTRTPFACVTNYRPIKRTPRYGSRGSATRPSGWPAARRRRRVGRSSFPSRPWDSARALWVPARCPEGTVWASSWPPAAPPCARLLMGRKSQTTCSCRAR